MLATYLIALREALEASLVVSILVAYVVRTGRPSLLPRIWAGVGLAVAASLAFGALLTFGPRGLSDRGEEVIAGTLSLLAVGLVTWMIFWMAKAARGIGAHLRGQVDLAVEGGRWALAIVALVAVGREGLETALFLWAITRSMAADTSSWEPVLGAALGFVTAIVAGWLLYKGSLRINLTRFFTWTGALLVVVAGGVLVYAVAEFQEAGVLPGEHATAFDLTGSIDPSTWYAVVVRGIFNLKPEMNWLEVGVWLAYVIPVLTLFLRRLHRPAVISRSVRVPVS